MNQSVQSDRASKCMKRSQLPNMVTKKPKEVILKCNAVLEKLIDKKPAEDESDALYANGEVIEHSDQETDSETDVEDNPVHEEYSDPNSNTNA
ncbi:hypothetical protein AVEN_73267-1 [Araneus ventricosus]|uniref:Uncharacterized protein n=1 Tax=Araneus ventricosus TaxID=182803 RepID=A0A4Y2F1R1_ARAVE|nr:hypothetical protein AVEN_73267-1 [Araneus ventricosus]